MKKDGSSAHFFHRTSNAYSTGHRKRRKIQNRFNLSDDHVRWHKTGKTRPVMENGVQRGLKKIMVLYKSSRKGFKPVKTSWVMHQYHLGTEEDEREGELVVSKIFFQSPAKPPEEIAMDAAAPDELEKLAAAVSPRTPKTSTPFPPRAAAKKCRFDEGDEDNNSIEISAAQQVFAIDFFAEIRQAVHADGPARSSSRIQPLLPFYSWS